MGISSCLVWRTNFTIPIFPVWSWWLPYHPPQVLCIFFTAYLGDGFIHSVPLFDCVSCYWCVVMTEFWLFNWWGCGVESEWPRSYVLYISVRRVSIHRYSCRCSLHLKCRRYFGCRRLTTRCHDYSEKCYPPLQTWATYDTCVYSMCMNKATSSLFDNYSNDCHCYEASTHGTLILRWRAPP